MGTTSTMGSSLTFDTYTSAVPRSVEGWATSDRGWAYSPREPEDRCVGFYLLYEARPGVREADEVLAVVYPHAYSPVSRRWEEITERSKVCATVEEARAWLCATYAALTAHLA